MDLRTDAAQRRRLLLDAADEVFCEHGVLAPLELVVERSGVGRATLYRNFADRTALMAALLQRGLDGLDGCARAIGERPDGLFLLLRDVAEHIAMSAPLTDYWRSMPRERPPITAAHTRVMAILLPFLQRAIDAGLCRAQLDGDDLGLLMDMLGACQRGSDEAERKALALRGWRLLCHALATPAAAAAL
ncbi:TetR/AcrR family transcriptional regulator [Xanthomonas hyacinthi]|uniref:TetR/AcrR family transcriptional regulator n=1 Tax=Xanthomonas hyacinthi TaxID=56455 RepID=A0A2S7F0B8_9XANT|nr:TetR/AcrR family transcriptional regulator [Xanthomonas hyacinthi]KLD76785.1 TetR family transcriptional regulator [Xanthomonas hyacinthi DSM 19077]PPU98796.1 TetR/AcrR family transcriptional regulator [Xanthomonas hyacinthi]QGY77622.1 TetR/AcrR family transcriptional regulator [Xanthomonas hyacinthi]